jgi:hypothetical protein
MRVIPPDRQQVVTVRERQVRVVGVGSLAAEPLGEEPDCAARSFVGSRPNSSRRTSPRSPTTSAA